MRIVLLHGAVAANAPADELDVLAEVDAISAALQRNGHHPIALPLTLDFTAVQADLVRLAPDLVFNLVESIAGRGRLAPLAAVLLDDLSIAYTGSSADALYLSSHKLLAKQRMAAAGLATPAWTSPSDKWMDERPMHGRRIVKSVWEHASIGLDAASVLTEDQDTAVAMAERRRTLGGDWFAETYIEGREFNIALLEQAGGARVLPMAEMCFIDFPPDQPRIVDYRAKWVSASFEYRHTVRSFDLSGVPVALRDQLSALALRCWQLFELSGYARVDMRVDADGSPWILEVNANPGLAPDAGFAAAAEVHGLDFDHTIAAIVAAAGA